MKGKLWILALSVATAAPVQAQAAHPHTLRGAQDLEWRSVAEPRGAFEAPLWGESAEGDRAVLVSLTFNTKVPATTRAEDLHLVVLAGTLTVEADGQYREFGPGAYANVPMGTEHALGCAATGQCTFLMHLAGGPTGSSSSP